MVLCSARMEAPASVRGIREISSETVPPPSIDWGAARVGCVEIAPTRCGTGYPTRVRTRVVLRFVRVLRTEEWGACLYGQFNDSPLFGVLYGNEHAELDGLAMRFREALRRMTT